ncbi:hypothetical protein KA005_46615, partial [bacterium]|nr:hypothetical protein [bacterium]
ESKNKTFSEIMAQLELGLLGNPNDRVDSPRPAKDFLDALDAAFVKDLGFGFQNMVSVLQIQCFWPAYAQNVEESTSYGATMSEIEDVCVKIIKDINSDEIKLIIDFLTLKKDDVIRVLGQDEPCQDLPVWEYRKRYARYNLKPIIKIGDQYHWGPYSARRTGLVWSGTASTGAMPADLQAENIEQVLRSEKKLIEDALADRTYEIVKRYTSNVRKNLKLHDLEPKGSHPQELGDYDVLSFHPENNIILSIECKDILPPYCLKDAKRLREKIFGRPGKYQGHFEQINKRKEYLREHIVDVSTALKWPIDAKNHPKIISIYLSRRSYWWTNFPPKEIEAEFIRVDLLSDFI